MVVYTLVQLPPVRRPVVCLGKGTENGNMTGKAILAGCAALMALGLPHKASAQDAAETAVILGTTGNATARGGSALGAAINRSMNSAGATISATRSSGRTSAARVTASRSRRSGGTAQAGIAAGTGDVLEGTDAPTYHLPNGASIRVSGGMSSQAAGTVCARDCPADEAP